MHILYILGLTYYSDGSGLTFDEMKSNCTVRNKRFCYYDELCPEGSKKAPLGGTQASTNMWAPIQTSISDTNPDWVQIGTASWEICSKHSLIRRVNDPGSWMMTNIVKSFKRIYPCCPKSKNTIYFLCYNKMNPIPVLCKPNLLCSEFPCMS